MRALKRFWKRLISPATRRQNEARLRAEIEEHLALKSPTIFAPVYRPSKRGVKLC